MPDWTEHATIYLSPWCGKCENAGCTDKFWGRPERLWCPEPQDPCEECGKPWVKFVLSTEQMEPEEMPHD